MQQNILYIKKKFIYIQVEPQNRVLMYAEINLLKSVSSVEFKVYRRES